MAATPEQVEKSLGSITAGPVSVAIVQALGDVWVTESKARAPVDTGQLRGRIAQTQVRQSGSGAVSTVESDVPYAGFVEFGTRYMPARPYFRGGRDKAVSSARSMGANVRVELVRSLKSGGTFNPRKNGWSPL